MYTTDNGYFLGLLQSKQRELLSANSERSEIVIEAVADEIDLLQQQLSRDMAVRSLDRKSRLLRNIQEAFIRIEDEIYGICLRCEEPIPPKRLNAIPWASHCVHCQETIDAQQQMYTDDADIVEFAA